ncbi:hypothetical protein [Herpetosiphon llansteffanensis]|uniref:hypothetical protein n=1 Tax=Herpetosiphon llansteffanensis TaxID=2094568 RepID=UPI000D7D0576|nr:hypothetical protein [Herpetosiphon llansteffanensis]
MTTVTKGIRLTDGEQDLLAAIMDANSLYFRSESDTLRVAALIGLRVLAVRGVLVGEPTPVNPAQLAAELAVELLPVYELLAQYDKLPAMLQRPLVAAMASPAAPIAAPPAPVVAPEASQTLRAFGTSFLDDEDDE